MEPLKHECGVAMVRLLKPLDYYQEKYGTRMWGLNKMYLLMEKQHNQKQHRHKPRLAQEECKDGLAFQINGTTVE